jgi:hypothetical protein
VNFSHIPKFEILGHDKNQRLVSWLSLKTNVVEGFRFGSQNRQLRFGDLDIKITVTVSWFEPQNQVGFGLSVASQNRRRKIGADTH